MDAFNAAHRHRKRGLAMVPTKFGLSFTAKFMNQAGALVNIYNVCARACVRALVGVRVLADVRACVRALVYACACRCACMCA